MLQLARALSVFAVFSAIGNTGTVTYFSRDSWELAIGPRPGTETFQTPDGWTNTTFVPSADFALAAVTSIGRSSTSSNTHPTVQHQDTSNLDLFAAPDGGNYVGTVGRTAFSTSTTTTTTKETCDSNTGTCVVDAPQEKTTWTDLSDVRSLEIDFTYVTSYFGFDYIATLGGSSPNRMTHPFRMIVKFVDGTTTRMWVGGGSQFSSYEEGFEGVTSDTPISSVILRAANRSLGSNQSSSAGDWVLTGSRPRKGLAFYKKTDTATTEADQTSTLVISNLTTTIPEPSSAWLAGFGGLLLLALQRYRTRGIRRVFPGQFPRAETQESSPASR